MRNPQKGNRVKIISGKHAGLVGVVTGVDDKGRALVQLPDVPYERAYEKEHLEFKGRETIALSAGEVRRKRMQVLVREGKMCPSYPFCCNGNCINTEEAASDNGSVFEVT